MKSIVIFLLILFTLKVNAQNKYQLRGTLLDEQSEPLISATATLLNSEDSTLVYFGITNQRGNFLMQGIKSNKYLLQISHLGYQHHFQVLEMVGDPREINLGEIEMIPQSASLDEVVIEGIQAPILIKKDTIQYNASSFKTQPNAVVEDLLKQLPGVEVEEDGTIKAQGEQVNKVLVDGKEFFGDDPKIASKNLPADAVDQVQVFDKMSDLAEFTGIDDGQRSKTINLALKEGHKNGTFGNVIAGYGNMHRYENRLNFNRFNKKTQFSLLSALNNVNKQTFSVDDYMRMAGGFTGLMSRGGNIEISVEGSGIDGGLNNGFVRSGSVGINLAHDFSDKSDLTLSYFLNDIKNDLDQSVERQYFLPDDDFYFENNIMDQVFRNQNHRLSGYYNLKIDSTQQLRVLGNLGLNFSKFSGLQNSDVINSDDQVQNESHRDNRGNGDGINGNIDLVYYKKLNDNGRNLAANFNSAKNSYENIAYLMSLNQFYIHSDSTYSQNLLQDQIQNNHSFNYMGSLSYTEPLGNNYYLNIKLAQSNNANNINQEVYDLIPTSLINEQLSNRYKQNYTYQNGGFTFTRNRKKTRLNVGGSFQRSMLNGKITIAENPVEKSFTNFLPMATYDLDFGPSRNLNFRYETSIRPPSLQQLQPVTDNSDPLDIYIGNPELKTEFRHNLTMHAFSFSQFSMISIFGFLRGTLVENKITNKVNIDDFFRKISTPINTKSGFELSGNLSFGAPLKFINSRIKINAQSNFSRENIFVNETENISNNFTQRLGFNINNRNIEKFEINLGADLLQNTISYSIQSSLDQTYTQQIYKASISYFPFKSIALRQSIRYSIFDASTLQNQMNIPIWNASMSYFTLQDKIEFKLSATDLLNKNIGINQRGSINYLEYRRSNTLGRYFMITINYSLNKFRSREGNVHIEKL